MRERETDLTERHSSEATWHDDLYEGKSIGNWMRSSLRAWLYSENAAGRATHLYRDKVIQYLPDGRILEIGSGIANNSIRLAQLKKNVYVSDISETAIRSLQHRARGLDTSVHGVVCAAEYLPFRDATFEMVFGESILHHTQLDRALKEIKRVTVRRSKCIFREPLQGSVFLKLFRRFTPDSRTPDERPFTISDINRLDSLFEIEESSFLFLLALLALPFALLSPEIATLIWRSLDRVDQAVLCIAPFTRRWFWQLVVVLRP